MQMLKRRTNYIDKAMNITVIDHVSTKDWQTRHSVFEKKIGDSDVKYIFALMGAHCNSI